MNSRRLSSVLLAALMLGVTSLALAQSDTDADEAQEYGYYGMGPGMMYGGPGAMGPGMMGPGMMYGGPGEMGPGMMGPGMMGPGMMGPGMMGPGMYGRRGMGQGMYGQGRGMGQGMYGQGRGMGQGMMGGYPGGGYSGGGYGPGYGRGYSGGGLGFGPMYNLSPEKRQKLTDIEADFEKTYWATVGKIQSHYGELQKLYATGKPDPKAVGDVYGKIFNLRRQIIEARVKAQNEARDVLSK